MIELRPEQLHEFVREVCGALGSEAIEARLVADQLIGANLAGHDSHGVGMLPIYVDAALAGRLVINQHLTVVRDSGPVVVLDGNAGFGQVMGHEAMTMATDGAREHGVALVGLRNSFHIGRIGHWAEQCAARGTRLDASGERCRPSALRRTAWRRRRPVRHQSHMHLSTWARRSAGRDGRHGDKQDRIGQGARCLQHGRRGSRGHAH